MDEMVTVGDSDDLPSGTGNLVQNRTIDTGRGVVDR